MPYFNPGPGKINLLLSFSMALVFLGLGFLFLFTTTWIDRYPKPYRTWMGIILSLWALFRGITVWMRFRRLQREEKENEE